MNGTEEVANNKSRPGFTGLFKEDGTFIKKVVLEDDKTIEAAVEVGDSIVSAPGRPGSNLAVSLGQAVAGKDGNIYVMRRTASALIYGISPAGAVVHRFEVTSPDPQMLPAGLQASANRLLVLFRNEHTKEQLLKVIDMETGDPVAAFKGDGGSALGCYQANDNRFIFWTNTKDGKLAVG